MEVKLENVIKDTTSCNFCNQGVLVANEKIKHYGLKYPYENVVTFGRKGNGIKCSICESCLDILIKNGKKLFNEQF